MLAAYVVLRCDIAKRALSRKPTEPLELPVAQQGWDLLLKRACYLATSQTAPAPAAAMATDIASAVAISLTHEPDAHRSALMRMVPLALPLKHPSPPLSGCRTEARYSERISLS
jgi:hypothetical protein